MKPDTKFDWQRVILSEHGPEDSTTRHVLLTLATHMSKSCPECFPSVGTLKKETGLARRTIQNHLKKARSRGWIEVKASRRTNGADSSNRYYATIPGEVKEVLIEEERGGERDAPGGAQEDRPNVNNQNEQVDADAGRAREKPEDPVELHNYYYPKVSLNWHQEDQISERVDDPSLWDAVLDYWKGNDYLGRSVKKMLNAYEDAKTHDGPPFRSHSGRQKENSGGGGRSARARANGVRAEDIEQFTERSLEILERVEGAGFGDLGSDGNRGEKDRDPSDQPSRAVHGH